MTPEQVAAMVADADAFAVEYGDWPQHTRVSGNVRALAAEVTRLTARVAEVTEQAKRAGDRVDATEVENETLRKRITTLSKERDRLRAAPAAVKYVVKNIFLALSLALEILISVSAPRR